jgi:MFS family permease
MRIPPFRAFRSLANANFRVWSAGALVSNIGTWIQRTAQDWLVLTRLTHHSAAAVGVVIGLQFGPQLLLLPFTGYAADRFDRRELLIATQSAMGALCLALGVLTVTGEIRLWHVYGFAFLSGCVAAFDAPASQTFVGDLVGDSELSNAVALNSTSFNAARMIGPAVAGVLIASVGTGWAFLINAASFLAVLGSLLLLRVSDLHPRTRPATGEKGFVEGFRYVAARPDLKAILLMLFLVCIFGLNFPIFISTMCVTVFHGGPGEYGLLTSVMAVGALVGAVLAAGRETPRFTLLPVGAAIFAVGLMLAALSPNVWLFGAALVVVGVSALTLTNTTNALMQLSTEPAMRGRVLAMRLAIALGGTPIGAPAVGWVADRFGPRWSLGLAAAAAVVGALVTIGYLVAHRGLRVRIEAGRPRLEMSGRGAASSSPVSYHATTFHNQRHRGRRSAS